LGTIAYEENLIVEGSAALALAGYEKAAADVAGQTSVLIMCGANVDRHSMRKEIFNLR
jgi:threonine dehydratase